MPRPAEQFVRRMYEHRVATGEDFSGGKLDTLTVVGSRFEGCRFENLRIGEASFGAGMQQSEYIDCSFDRLRMSATVGGYARFVRCSFRDVDIRKWRAYFVELIDCVFTGRLRDCVFWGSAPDSARHYDFHVRTMAREGLEPPPGFRELSERPFNEFHGNDFSGAEFNVTFRGGIDLSRQRLPTGPDYVYLSNAVADLARAIALIDTSTDVGDRAVDWLNAIIGPDIASGQTQLLLRESPFVRKPDSDHVKIAFAALREVANG